MPVLRGLVCGVGLVALWVSLLNRDGPGEVCTATETGGHCVDEWNPWPWLAAGVLFVAGGIALFLWLSSQPSTLTMTTQARASSPDRFR